MKRAHPAHTDDSRGHSAGPSYAAVEMSQSPSDQLCTKDV